MQYRFKPITTKKTYINKHLESEQPTEPLYSDLRISTSSFEMYLQHIEYNFFIDENMYLYLFDSTEQTLSLVYQKCLAAAQDNIQIQVMNNKIIMPVHADAFINFAYNTDLQKYFLQIINIKKEDVDMLKLQIFSAQDQLLWDSSSEQNHPIHLRFENALREQRIILSCKSLDNNYILQTIPDLIRNNLSGSVKFFSDDYVLAECNNNQLLHATFSLQSNDIHEELYIIMPVSQH